jgi:hypothetical protein
VAEKAEKAEKAEEAEKAGKAGIYNPVISSGALFHLREAHGFD